MSQWRTRWRTMPFLLRMGLLVFALGGTADIAVHAGIPGLSQISHSAHLLTLAGMAVTLLGVILEHLVLRRTGFARASRGSIQPDSRTRSQS